MIPKILFIQQVEVFQTKAQMWTGPTEKCDVALLFHVMFYLDEGFVKKCFEWLKPPGHMVISLIAKEGHTIYHTGD